MANWKWCEENMVFGTVFGGFLRKISEIEAEEGKEQEFRKYMISIHIHLGGRHLAGIKGPWKLSGN
jgi:hypothetical protein